MFRDQLEHIIRAAGTITDTDSITVVGSQAILASIEGTPKELCQSIEADIYPTFKPHLSDLIDGCIGELSPFHDQFGYYAQGVGPETSILGAGWQERLVKLENKNTKGVTGLCLHPIDITIDITIAKLGAGREKDFSYVEYLMKHSLVSIDEVEKVLGAMCHEKTQLIKDRLSRIKNQLKLA